MSLNIFAHKMIARVIIIFLTLSTCYLFWAVWIGRTRNQHFHNADYASKALRPVLYVKPEKKYLDVVQDVCQRWGYSVEPLPQAAYECVEDQDQFKRFYCRVMKHRIYQNQSSDKIWDFVPVFNEFVTFKAKLVVNGGKYIPKGFVIPDQMEQFLRYLSLPENKNKRWIQKNIEHRGNSIKDVTDLDLTNTSLVQEYIGKPLTIDGRKFSMGIYSAISSVNPLRVHVLESTFAWRFSEKEYYPKNVTDPRTYVTDGHELYGIKYASEVEPMRTYTQKNNYAFRKAFDVYLRSLGKDPALVFAQIYDAIRDVLGKNVDKVEENSDGRAKYVELIRWDFIVDENLSVYLLEVNFDPSTACKVAPALGKYYCHHFLYNLYRVMGLERPLQWRRSSELHIRNTDVNIMSGICYSPRCSLCNPTGCHLCPHCLPQHQQVILKQVLYEHLYQGETRLVYPLTKSNIDENATPSIGNNSHLRDQFLVHWLAEKCNQDRIWCLLPTK